MTRKKHGRVEAGNVDPPSSLDSGEPSSKVARTDLPAAKMTQTHHKRAQQPAHLAQQLARLKEDFDARMAELERRYQIDHLWEPQKTPKAVILYSL